MAFNNFLSSLQWFGNDSLFKFPIYSEDVPISGQRDNTLGSPTRGLIATTQGAITRLPLYWKRRCKMTIPANVVSGRHAVLRILVTNAVMPAEVLDDTDANSCSPTGNDIKFSMDVDGLVEVPCEVVTITKDASPANQRAEIWVLVPNVDSVNGGEFYMWWCGVDSPQLGSGVTPTHFSPLNVWEFYRDYITGCHGPHPSAGSPKSIRRSSMSLNDFATVTSSGLVSGADQWGGNGAFYYATGATSRYLRVLYNNVMENTLNIANGCISMWVLGDTASYGGSDKYLFSFNDGAGSTSRMYLKLTGTTLQFSIIDAGGATQSVYHYNFTDDGLWHYIVAVWNHGEIDGVMELYVDGTLSGSVYINQSYGKQSTFVETMLSIGNAYNSTANHWEGYIDDFRMGNFPYPNGLASTEHVNQWAETHADSVIPDTVTTPTIPSSLPYTAGDRQYLMVGPKNNGDMPTRYKIKYTPVTYFVRSGDMAAYGDNANRYTFNYDATKDPQGVNSFCFRYTPSTTKKGFLVYRQYNNYDADVGDATSNSLDGACYGSDPSFSSSPEPRRAAAYMGYLRYNDLVTYPTIAAQHGILFVDAVASKPVYFWFQMQNMAVIKADEMLVVGWVDMPAASSAAAPNDIAYQDTGLSVVEYMDDCLSNGDGATKDIYLKLTFPYSDTRNLVINSATYEYTFTLVDYGTDSTFTTPAATYTATRYESLPVSGTLGDVFYYKITPTNPHNRLIIQAIYGD